MYLVCVALKINVKVNGRNTVLCDALSKKLPLVRDQPTIIFGVDVCHPSPGDDSSPSIAAVVASQDWPQLTKYLYRVSAQAHNQELIQDFCKTWEDSSRGTVALLELLLSFYQSTGHKPQCIVFYRVLEGLRITMYYGTKTTSQLINFSLLTNDLCYKYARCTKSVYIVGVGRFHMEPEISDRSSKTKTPDAANAAVRLLLDLKDYVKRAMFYC